MFLNFNSDGFWQAGSPTVGLLLQSIPDKFTVLFAGNGDATSFTRSTRARSLGACHVCILPRTYPKIIQICSFHFFLPSTNAPLPYKVTQHNKEHHFSSDKIIKKKRKRTHWTRGTLIPKF